MLDRNLQFSHKLAKGQPRIKIQLARIQMRSKPLDKGAIKFGINSNPSGQGAPLISGG